MSKGNRIARTHGRSVLVLACIFALLALVAARLIYLQVVAAPAFAERAVAQRTSEIELAPRRGAILDREGVPLASSVEARTIFATPRRVSDATATAHALASVLGGDPARFAEKLRRDSGFVYIARRLDMERAEAIEELNLDGIDARKDSRRQYPYGDLASQLLGFVGVDDVGLSGLESRYESILAGAPGMVLAERDPSGRVLPNGVIHMEPPVDGDDIILTIDRDIQYVAQSRLYQAMEEWQASSGTIIVMDPASGEIFAMASVPGFDSNEYSLADEAARRTRALTDVYEPGSTLKSLVSAAVLDAGVFQPEDMFELPPTIVIGGRTIGEARPRELVSWSMTEIHARSSNVGSVKLGIALGPERLHGYLERFGLNEPTGIDFPGEAVGHLPPVSEWSGSTIGNIPFGQGLSVTPLQLARAFAAIANDGWLPTPHLLRAVPAHPEMSPERTTRQVISADAADATVRMMIEAVVNGTGSQAAVDGYQVAGKTGTAQKARTDGRGYMPGAYISSFAGFLPACDPRVLIVVTVDEPKGAYYGGVVAGPVFKDVAAFAVRHLGIPPSSTSVSSCVETVTVEPIGE